jgi:hypothetical protein
MLRQRINYWSCSRFADWVRGEKKPYALGWDEWDEWRDEVSKRRPVRFFLAEKGLNGLQNLVMFPADLWRTARNKIRLRFFDRPYCLDTGLSKWEWHEIDERIIHALFNTLKDYVEVELASMFISTDRGEFKMKGGRCPEAGIANLEWQSELKYGDSDFIKKSDPRWGKPTPQAVSAKKILELYRWWLARPSRTDPMKASGWSEVYESKDERKRSMASKRLQEIEDEYDREDEKMLVRLIKLRKSLWT